MTSSAIRRIVALGGVLLLCAACGSTKDVVVKRSPLCRAVITWHEHLYFPRRVAALPARREILGVAGVPSCTDVLGGENGASRAVEVRRIAGIDPRVAIAVADDREHAYIAAGHSLRLPGS
jgi:hypothetical protein